MDDLFLKDEELVNAVKNGEEDAFRVLLERYNRFISFYARKVYIKGFSEEDLEQELRIVLFKAAKTFDAEAGTAFLTYFSIQLRSCVKNIIRDHNTFKRKANSFIVSNINEDAPELLPPKERGKAVYLSGMAKSVCENPEEFCLRKELEKDIFSLMDVVLKEREIMCMRLFLQGYSCKDIALKLNISEKWAYSLIRRTQKKMKDKSE